MTLIDEILKPHEAKSLLEQLGREPSSAELAMVSAMWSEHCSYKHSLYFLKTLPRHSPRLLAGMGENAGILKIRSDLAIAFKIESHNHPSAVMPYQGAATGAGGILRDIFTMGARPVALMDSLHFDLDDPLGWAQFEGALEGIADYGNCMGIPTMGGQVEMAPYFRGNPLVNAFCLGVLDPKKMVLSSTAEKGDLLLYFGNPTGRDGLEGAIFASLELSEKTRERKSAVQMADPFMGKIIMEASLELVEKGLVKAMQDMGAAGLTCSSSEMALKSQLGVVVNLDNVPTRTPGMTAEELLLSESQERMAAAISPDKKEEVEKILEKYPLQFSWIGHFTDSKNMEVFFQQNQVSSIPLDILLEGCPKKDFSHLEIKIPRPFELEKSFSSPGKSNPIDLEEALSLYQRLTHLQEKSWVYEQFDYGVTLHPIGTMKNSRFLLHFFEENLSLALSMQSRSLWMSKDAYYGTLATLALCLRRSIALGAYPLGITNCMNFPSPEKEKNILDFGKTVQALKDFCEGLEIPVTGGNVSFYNETPTSEILPTPVFVTVGESIYLEPPPKWQKNNLLVGIGQWSWKQSELAIWQQILPFYEKEQAIPWKELDFEIPLIQILEEKRLAKVLLKYLGQYPKLWLMEIGRGGLYKRAFENIEKELDIHLDCPPSMTELDFLFGEGPFAYLLALPKDLQEILPSLKKAFPEIPFLEIGEIQEGRGRIFLENKELPYPSKGFDKNKSIP